jgi:hypothetical protein
MESSAITTTAENIKTPKSFDEAVKQLVDYMIEKAKEGDVLATMNASKMTTRLHFGFGRQLRNSWHLWEENDLTKDFNSKGIFHADDMSSLIITAAVTIFQGKPFDFIKEAAEYWKHWIMYDPNGLGKRTREYLKIKKVTKIEGI